MVMKVGNFILKNISRENGLGLIINEVLDCHRTMSTIYEEQSIADRLIVELATDYSLLVESAMEVITTRRNLQVRTMQGHVRRLSC